jgi:tetratricopeptide (TPR) repeat protein
MLKKKEPSNTQNNFLINKLADSIKHTKRKPEEQEASLNFALFLGAGASVSSGVIGAGKMIQHFKEKIYSFYEVDFFNVETKQIDKKKEKEWLKTQDWYLKEGNEYGRFFGKCYETEGERRNYIESLIEGKEPSFGYMILANLIYEGYLKTIITTNFDDLIYIACTTFTQTRPVVYSLGGFATEMSITGNRPRILKLHGDYLYSDLRNIETDFQKDKKLILKSQNNKTRQDSNMQKEVEEIFRNYDGIIVVGYGGADSSIINLLKEIPRGKIIYWCYRSGDKVNENVKQIVSDEGRHLVSITGFDELMDKIRQKVGISNKELAFNFKNNLQKVTDLLFQYEDDSTIDFVDEIANTYQLLSLSVHGDKALEKEEFIEAEKFYRKVIELKPDSARTYYKVAGLLSKDSTRKIEAEEHYRKAIELKSDDVSAYFDLEELISEEFGRKEESLQLLQKILEIEPDNSIAYVKIGFLLEEDSDKTKEAEAAYRKAIELDPDISEYHYFLGVLLSNYETRNKEAEKAFRKAIKLKPNESDSYFRLGFLLSNNSSRNDEAEKFYRKAIELKSDDEEYYRFLGILLSKDKSRFKEAEELFRKAIKLNPTYAEGFFALAILLSEDKTRFKESERLFKKSIELNPKESLYYYFLGYLLFKDKPKHKEAEKAFRKAIKLNPEDADIYFSLGNLLFDNPRRHKEAEEVYRKAIELNPNLANSYNNLANLLMKDEAKFDEAEVLYKKAIELNPNTNSTYNNLVNLLRRRNKIDEALKTCNLGLNNNIFSREMFLHLAALNKTKGNKEEAIKYAFKAKELIKEDGYYDLACLYSILDKKDESFENLKKAIEVDSTKKQWSKEDLDLEWIRDDSRFTEIVGESE